MITITNQKPLLKALAVAVNFIEAYIRTQTTHMGNVSYVKKKELACTTSNGCKVYKVWYH